MKTPKMVITFFKLLIFVDLIVLLLGMIELSVNDTSTLFILSVFLFILIFLFFEWDAGQYTCDECSYSGHDGRALRDVKCKSCGNYAEKRDKK